MTLSPISFLPALAVLIFLPHALALPAHDVHAGENSDLTVTPLNSEIQFFCVFKLEGYTFNLCPLADLITTAEKEHHGPSSSPLSPPSSSPPTSEWLGSDFDDVAPALANFFEPSDRSLESQLVVTSTQYAKQLSGSLHGQPIITFSFADKEDPWRVPISRVSFVCDTSSDLRGWIHSAQTFEDGHWGAYTFDFNTRSACPVEGPTGSAIAVEGGDIRISEDQEAEPIPPTDETPAEGDDSFLPHKPRWGTPRQWIAGLLLFTGVVVISATVISTSPRARFFVLEKIHAASAAVSPLASRALGKVKPLARRLASALPTSLFYVSPPFRQRDNQLVQWAEEDMALQEDYMVNGSGAYELDGEDWNGRHLDEYIPLTFSPRWGKKVRSYGSTPLRDVFGVPERGGAI